MSLDLLRDFVLDAGAVSVLATMQRDLVLRDIAATSRPQQNNLKITWYHEWFDVVTQGLSELSPQDRKADQPGFLTELDLTERLDILRSNRTESGLVLLELVAFSPYFPLSEDEAKAKRFKGLSLDKQTRKAALKMRSQDLGFPDDRASQLERAMQSSLDSLTGKWVRIGFAAVGGLALAALTMGLAAPAIGAAVGGILGLKGAAATAAGLAAIGGGAVAAGGLGWLP
jgi:hypothetical protein